MSTEHDRGGQATRAYWQSLAEWLEASGEAGDGRTSDTNAVDRRDLLKVLAASLGLAGVSGCDRQKTEKMLPYTVPPEEMVPGIARTYATSMELDGFATGLLVRSNDGRPSKIEGNPDHPASLGAAGVYEQAAVLGLYDPHRARATRYRTNVATFDTIAARLAQERRDHGEKLRLLLPPTGSPLVTELLGRVRARHPEARITFDAPLRTPYAAEGGRLAFGSPVQPQYDFTRATVIVSIDADFLSAMPFSLRYARQFASRRRTSHPTDPMTRLYVVESMLTATGSAADHRLRRRPSEISGVLGAIAAELAIVLPNRGGSGWSEALAPLQPERDRIAAAAIARDLARDPSAGLVVVGEAQPAVVHALAYLINVVLLRSNAFGAIAPTLVDGGGAGQSLAELIRDMADHRVDTLLMLDGNPAYSAPPDLEFGRRLALVEDSVYLGLYENETAEQSTWFIPAAHFLEAWGDARAYDGTVSFVQPLIDPLWGGRTSSELLAILAGDRNPSGRTLLRGLWERSHPGSEFAAFWEEIFKAGFLANSAPRELVLNPKTNALGAVATAFAASRPSAMPSLELAFYADPGVYDGRFANNGWLQEFPRPLTKLTWDNAALISRETAARLGVANEDEIEIHRMGRSLRLPVLVVPGHADGAISVNLGFGRSGAEALARGVGANAFALRTSDVVAYADSIDVRKVPGAHHLLALTQRHFSTEGRPVAMSRTLEEWRAAPDFASGQRGPVLSLYAPPYPREGGEQWAMTIDTSICTGCGACVLGCQSENNIFVVGKENVAKGREMHWLRIDTYYSGSPDNPEVVSEPMLCQHCEKAPCEYVCPVNATVHSPDGLNEMVYNRCVGTRFCSNNCPYKVRRFNWFDWVDRQPANQGLVRLQRNPNVTVRERGVMEKCTYCVQRIRIAEIGARNEHRSLRPGEVMTACQQACPTQAIQFGSLAHTETEMVQWRHESRAFSVLHELGTEPRTRYLARVRNPNPEFGS